VKALHSRLERLARDKHSSVLRKSVKRFIGQAPGQFLANDGGVFFLYSLLFFKNRQPIFNLARPNPVNLSGDPIDAFA
jgi:hypothetical protein